MNAMPINQTVNREAIRILVQDIGYTRTSERSGIKRDTLYKWGQRYGWKEPVQHAQSMSVQSVQSPADIHASELEANGHITKLGLSKHSRHAITAINASVHPAKWTKEAHEIARTAALVHGWDKGDKDSAQVAVNIAILSS